MYYLRSNTTLYIFKLIVYEGMGVGFIAFWIVNIALIIQNIFKIEAQTLGILSLIIIFFLCILSLIYGKLIFVKKIKVNTSKVDNDIKIIFLSDVHLGSNSKRHLSRLYSKIKTIKYDLLLIGGDLIDSSSFDLKDLKLLREIKQPILFVSGNHEFYIKNHMVKLRDLKNYNINYLDDKNYIYKSINIIGVGDNHTLEKQIINTNKLINDKYFNLLLVHKPSVWEHVNTKIDLMLSGHTHYGQIFPFNIFVKIKFKYIYGLYKNIYSKLYVSSGSGCWGPSMRLGTKNEIVEIFITNN